MMRYKLPFLFLFFGCTAPEKEIADPVIAAEESGDTIHDIAIKEVQYVEEDSSILYETLDKETDGEYDFSWVPGECGLFSISLEDDEIEFRSETLTQVTISYRLETSISISAEGPHCDLIHWKHGATSWEKMEHLSGHNLAELKYTRFKFKINPYERTEKLPFPVSDMAEINSEVQKTCGSEWADHIKDCKDPYDYPCNVGISNFIFRVSYLSDKNGEMTHSYLKIPVPMGC